MRQPFLARVLPDVRILALIAGLLVPGLGTAASSLAYARPAAQVLWLLLEREAASGKLSSAKSPRKRPPSRGAK